MPKRWIARSLISLFVIGGLIGISWLVNQTRSAPIPIESISTDFDNRLGAGTDRLIDQLQTRLRSVPDDFAAYSQLGLAYLQKARETGDPTWYQKAEGVLTRALQLQPDDYTATAAMGTLELARHQFSRALDWGERARQINPDRAYAYGVVADAQIELGRYPEAIDTLQAMVNLRPDAASYARISYLRELHGDMQGAIDLMQAAVEAGSPAAENTAWLRTQLGNLYFNRGDLPQAEREYRSTLNLAPTYVYALAGLARVRYAQQKPDEALALLTQAVQSMPLPEFVITLGEMYEAAGDQGLARQQYDLVRAMQQLYVSNGVDLDLEIALFNADHNLDLTATLQQAREGYARRPSTYAADVLAWVLYKTGHYEEAEKYSEEALRLGAQDALKYFHAGMIAKALGHSIVAQDDLERAVKLNPHFSVLYGLQAEAALRELSVASRK